jgi:hypothetical protein
MAAVTVKAKGRRSKAYGFSATPTPGFPVLFPDHSIPCFFPAVYKFLVMDSLSHFVIFTETQLRRVVKATFGYYNNYRPHQGLRGIPNAPPEQPETGDIKRKQLVFCLHSHYYREAA